jgi:hypothetical protein
MRARQSGALANCGSDGQVGLMACAFDTHEEVPHAMRQWILLLQRQQDLTSGHVCGNTVADNNVDEPRPLSHSHFTESSSDGPRHTHERFVERGGQDLRGLV